MDIGQKPSRTDIFYERSARERQYLLQSKAQPSRAELHALQRMQFKPSEAVVKKQKKKKRKAKKTQKTLRGEVARIMREQRRYEQGERRDRPEQEPRVVGDPQQPIIQVVPGAPGQAPIIVYGGAAPGAAAAAGVPPAVPVAPAIMPPVAPIPAGLIADIGERIRGLHEHMDVDTRQEAQRQDARWAEINARLGVHEEYMGEARGYAERALELQEERLGFQDPDRPEQDPLVTREYFDRSARDLGGYLQRMEEGQERRFGDFERRIQEVAEGREIRLGQRVSAQDIASEVRRGLAARPTRPAQEDPEAEDPFIPREPIDPRPIAGQLRITRVPGPPTRPPPGPPEPAPEPPPGLPSGPPPSHPALREPVEPLGSRVSGGGELDLPDIVLEPAPIEPRELEESLQIIGPEEAEEAVRRVPIEEEEEEEPGLMVGVAGAVGAGAGMLGEGLMTGAGMVGRGAVGVVGGVGEAVYERLPEAGEVGAAVGRGAVAVGEAAITGAVALGGAAAEAVFPGEEAIEPPVELPDVPQADVEQALVEQERGARRAQPPQGLELEDPGRGAIEELEEEVLGVGGVLPEEEGVLEAVEEAGAVKVITPAAVHTSLSIFEGSMAELGSSVRPGPRQGLGFKVQNNTSKTLKGIPPGATVNIIGVESTGGKGTLRLNTGTGTAKRGSRVGVDPFRKLLREGKLIYSKTSRL